MGRPRPDPGPGDRQGTGHRHLSQLYRREDRPQIRRPEADPTRRGEKNSADLTRVKRLLETLAATVPADAPWTAEHARAWDDKTVADWLAENTRDAETRETFRDRPLDRAGPLLEDLAAVLPLHRPVGGQHPAPSRTTPSNDGSSGGRNRSPRPSRHPWPTSWCSTRPRSGSWTRSKLGSSSSRSGSRSGRVGWWSR